MVTRSIVYRLSADIAGFRAQMAQAGASVRGAADDMTAATKEGDRFRQGLSSVGQAGGAVGLAAAAGLGAAITTAAKFDSAMSSVEAATHESASGMDDLRAAALKAGADTVFSASEAAGGIEALAKAGVATKDILGGALNGALSLAAAGELQVGDAAEAAATAMTQFNLSGADVPHIADLLAAGAGKAQGEVSDLSQALNQSGLVAGQMGLSIEETTGTLAAFASAGLIGSDAGTSLKTMLLRLANPASDAAATMESLGIAAYDAQGNFVGLQDLAGQLKGAFEGQTQAQRDAALATIFGSDAIRAANVLYSQGAKGIGEWTGKVNDQGFAAETAAIKLDNLQGDIEAFTGSLETAFIKTGEGAQGPLRSVVQGATDAVNAFNNMPPVVGNVTSSLLGITAVTGGALWLGATVINKIAVTRLALADLGTQAATTRALLSGIGSVAGIAAVAVVLNQVVDAADDVTFSTAQMTLALNDLAEGRVNEQLSHLTWSVDSLGEALHQAAFADVSIFGGAEDEIAALDSALAQLATTAPGRANRIFANIQTQGADAGVPLEDLVKLFPQLQAQLDLMASQAPTTLPWKTMSGDVPIFLRGMHDVAGAFEKASAAGLSFKDVLKIVNDALEGRATFRDYQASIDDFTTAFEKARKSGDDFLNGQKTGFNDDIALGRDLEAQYDNIASSALAYAKTLDKPARNKFLADTREQLVTSATAFLGSRKAAEDYVDELGILDRTKATPKVGADTKEADDKIGSTQRELDKTDHTTAKPRVDVQGTEESRRKLGDVDDAFHFVDRLFGGPTVKAETANALADLAAVQARMAAIDGSVATVTVRQMGGQAPGSAFAGGGYISGPGTATSDSVPILASNGEFVVKAAAVDRYGVDFLHAVNSMRYAQGGLIGTSPAAGFPSTVGLSGADIARLAAAVAQARPLYGDVHLSGDGSFEREQLRAKRAAAGGGVRF